MYFEIKIVKLQINELNVVCGLIPCRRLCLQLQDTLACTITLTRFTINIGIHLFSNRPMLLYVINSLFFVHFWHFKQVQTSNRVNDFVRKGLNRDPKDRNQRSLSSWQKENKYNSLPKVIVLVLITFRKVRDQNKDQCLLERHGYYLKRYWT